jgi:diguanylate cyclase (GGDEF)-like protein
LKSASTKRRSYIVTVLVAIVGILISGGMYEAGMEAERRLDELQLQDRARDHEQTINAHLNSTSELLYTLRGYFDATERPVGRIDFQAFAKILRGRLIGLRNTGWAPRVTLAERDDFERAVRAEGFVDFEIKERDAAGRIVRAAERAEYFPVLYPDPMEIAPEALGFDLGSESVRHDAMRRARAYDAPAATPPTILITPGEPHGFMNFLPVYGKPANGTQGPLRGFVYGVFATGPMIESILQAKMSPGGLDIYFFDRDRQPGDRRIHWHASPASAVPASSSTEAALRAGRHWEGVVRVADQAWGVIFAPTRMFARVITWTPIVVLAAGLTITALLVAYLLISLRHTLRQEQLTESLAIANRDFLALFAAFDQVEIGVLILNRDLTARFINKWNRERWGIPDDIAESNPSFADLVRLAYAGHRFRVRSLDAYIDERVAQLRSGDATSRHIEMADGDVIQYQGTMLPDGGWILTYSRVTELVRHAEQFEKLANTDVLTGVSNRRHFLALAEAEWGRLHRYGRRLSLLMLDIDLFKTVNDRFGHDGGDLVIRMVADLCRETKRDGDILARMGGEEFALLLPETDLTSATILAERIRQRVESEHVEIGDDEVHVTVSIGVVQADAAAQGLRDLMASADAALYAAKRNGRNRVIQSLDGIDLAPGAHAVAPALAAGESV